MSSSLQTTIRDLHRRRGRERRGLALAEGVRLVEEALASGIPIRGAAVSPALEATPRGRALKAALATAGVPLEEVPASGLDGLADTEHPQGIVAVVQPRRWSVHHMEPGTGVVLVLDAVQDPGNVGTMLRTSLALGAAGVVALPGTADLANPKVMRGSMGAIFRLAAAPATLDELLEWAGRHGVRLWVAAADGDPLTAAAAERARSPYPVALVVGNEGAGISEALAARADRRVGIPLAPESESLNAGVAAGILLYEVLRGR
ncbi:MAG TPA: RNA methyltransferase [Gemmatimonadales bacterium]